MVVEAMMVEALEEAEVPADDSVLRPMDVAVKVAVEQTAEAVAMIAVLEGDGSPPPGEYSLFGLGPQLELGVLHEHEPSLDQGVPHGQPSPLGELSLLYQSMEGWTLAKAEEAKAEAKAKLGEARVYANPATLQRLHHAAESRRDAATSIQRAARGFMVRDELNSALGCPTPPRSPPRSSLLPGDMPDSPLDFVAPEPAEPEEHTPPSTPPRASHGSNASSASSSSSPTKSPARVALDALGSGSLSIGQKTIALWKNVSRGTSRWMLRARASAEQEAHLRV